MHPTTLATLRGQALDRITFNARALCERLDLDPALVAGLTPAIKQPEVKELRRLEGIADLLSVLAISAGAVKESEPAAPVAETVTAETLPTDQAPVEPEASVPAAEASEPAVIEEEPAPEEEAEQVLEQQAEPEPETVERKAKSKQKSKKRS